MNKYILLIYSLAYFLSISTGSFCQSGTWIWISGDSTLDAPGIYGTMGIPSIYNHPPANYEMAEWKDKQGNFWVYGGTYPGLDDMWKFNPVTMEWTWVMGDSTLNVNPSYGTKGIPGSLNTPGAVRYAAATWVDTSGSLWLFGGLNCTNDLWKFDPGVNEWTWMSGNHVADHGHHGSVGVADTSVFPSPREETASAWTDSLNNLWLFGGYGYDDNYIAGDLNDVMRYNIAANEWTWIRGSAYVNAAAVYGIKGVSNSTNDPGARLSYTRWKDKQGNFWIFGGIQPQGHFLNDVWNYNTANNEWTWMNGTNVFDDTGRYVSKCAYDTSYRPGARTEQRSNVTDNCNRFWLFGGYDLTNYGFNDLWVFDPQLLQWKWISGSASTNQPGNYGSKGTPSTANIPPSRIGANAWWGNDNKFYLFGGMIGSYVFCRADVWVFDPDTSCIPVCSLTTPPVAGFLSYRTSICANDCINFTDLSTNATSWKWSFAGGNPTTSTDKNPQQVCYLATGVYDVTLIASNSGGSDSITFTNYVTVNPSPPNPIITQRSDTLYCSTNPSYTSYQWFADTTLIPGATDTLLLIARGGNYNVQVSNENGCSVAVGINIILGLQNYMKNHAVSCYPNPVKEKFTIYNLQFTNERIEIYNILGQVCQQSEIVNRKSEIQLDVSSLPAGIYFIQLSNERERWVGKFVKE